MSSSVCTTLIEIGQIAATKGRSQRALIEHAEPLHSMNTKTSKKALPSRMLGDTPNTPPIYFNLSKEHVL